MFKFRLTPNLPVFFLLNIICIYTYAQKERNIWCFGNNCELDFNSGSPVFVPGCAEYTVEGCASIANRNTGALLFYSDGSYVLDRTNKVMPSNTFSLGGNSTTTQSAYILPNPADSNQYYLFCTDYGGYGGTQYCIIDMTLHNGLGDVRQQPVLLLSPTTEKAAAASMPDNTGYWMLFHQYRTDAFYAYPVTTAGIGAPVITHAGVVHTDAVSYMHFSTDGKKLAVAMHGSQDMMQLFNFNDSTGVLSEPTFTDHGYGGFGPYGVCFSPSNQMLYISVNGDSAIYQYNLGAGDSSAILASKYNVSSNWKFNEALQLGPDNKIYVAKYGATYLDRIEQPDSLGAKCNFVDSAVSLLYHICQSGLPEFPPVRIVQGCQSYSVSIAGNNSVMCASDSTFICAPGGYSVYLWNAGNSTDSCLKAKQAGNYYVTVTDNNGCTAESNHVALSVYPLPSVSVSVHDDTLTSFNAVSYQWFLNNEPISNATDSFFIATQPGTYALAISDTNGCAAFSTAIIITGIDDLVEEKFLVYPNPNTTGSWQLETTNQLIGSRIEILDEEGRLVFKSEIRITKQDISFTAARGIYLLRISSAGNSVVRKLVRL